MNMIIKREDKDLKWKQKKIC